MQFDKFKLNLVEKNMNSITRIGGFSKMFVTFVTILTIGGIRLDVYQGDDMWDGEMTWG